MELKRAGAGEEQATGDGTAKISKDTKKVTIVDASGSRYELTQNVNGIGYIRTSDTEIDKAANKMAITSRILKRNTVSGTKTEVELHGGVHRTVISKARTGKEILNVLLLGEIVPSGEGVTSIPRK